MDDIISAVKTCFQKYVDFSGRATRPEFWWFFLFQLVVLIVTGMVSNIVYGLAALAMLLPGLAVGARRLHDIGKSGWWLLIGLIPLVGLYLLYLLAQPTGPANAYGGGAGSPDAPAVIPPGQQ
ncbi:DUF805 domain-containing protein [Ramlibacter sp. WS9]|uniref:DUF805 domain-containing protein n=1 Tax=Ramlibacter sp. WS9 TaxID=1882741 RepID=UPI0011425AC1|nr:DUF805 domain-containing protein [Ramlibacter sp. WS9]ROZ79520.1 DUF805 domain-containing protein [Ramlibacter sp. WS9]